MTKEDPLLALLPKGPLPRPDRREAAIGEAMRRFDGEQGARRAAGRSPRAGRAWLATPWGRPQIGAVLATALVGLLALPLWVSRERHPELTSPGATTFAVAPSAPAPANIAEQAVVPPPIVAAPPATDGAVSEGEQRAATDRAEKAEAAPKVAGEVADSAAKPDTAGVVVSRRAANLAPPAIVLADPVAEAAPPASPRAAPTMARAAAPSERDEGPADVIVTARRVDDYKAAPAPRRPLARRTSRAGDWNACTINDPTRRLESCADGASGHVANGLARGWTGDLDGAIAAFDQAIAASQQPGLAYLNRGLAYERKGDRDRAMADLDQAVRQAPSARAYYHRSLAFEREGEKARARADADRAIDLDPRYSAVIR